MKKVGLTGGIASGKTTVAKFFKELKVPVVSADHINGFLLDNDKDVFREIKNYFGEGVVSDYKLDRRKIAEEIFSDKEKKEWLENLLHPKIREELLRWISKIQGSYCIIEIPILFEANFQDMVDVILVVDIPDDIKIKRASLRDNKSEEEIKKIIENQVDRQYRLDKADDIIDTSKSIDDVRAQVLELHNKYM